MVEDVEVPSRLVATSLNVYEVPLVKPNTVVPVLPGANVAVWFNHVSVIPFTLLLFLGSLAQVREIVEPDKPLIAAAVELPANPTGA